MPVPFRICVYVIVFSLLLTAVVNFFVTSASTHKINKSANDYVTIFTNIYNTHAWGNGSGSGSEPRNAAQYVNLLQKYFNDPRFNTIADLGCGDWQIMSQIKIPTGKIYTGFDVVPKLIAVNKAKYSKSGLKFSYIRDLKDFKKLRIKADLLIIKDVMQHWPNKEIHYFIREILPNFKYALITNAYKPDPDDPNTYITNADIKLGAFRPLDLIRAPFNMHNVEQVLEYSGPEPKLVLLYVNPQQQKS